MSTGTTTVRVAMETADRIAALRASDGGSTDAVLREALDALYWSRMAEAAQRTGPRRDPEHQAETARAVQADLDAGR